jgi:hypothetical protein
MKKVNVAFVCCTPFHIIATLKLAAEMNDKKKIDIFICDHFIDARTIYENIKFSNIDYFHNIYFVEDKKVNYDNSFLKYKKILSFIKKELFISNIERENFKYDEIYIFTFSYFSNLLIDVNKRDNIEISLVEEGIMTYLLNNSSKKNKIKSFLSKVLKIFLNRSFLNVNQINSIYLFEPSFYSGNLKIPIKPIKKINDLDIKNIINVFGGKNKFENPPFTKILFLEQPNENPIFPDSKKVVNHLQSFFPKENFSVKLHPRSKIITRDVGKLNLYQSNLPWEIDCSNLNSSNLLISINSSAVFTPYIIYGYTYNILILNKLYNITDTYFDKFITKIKANFKGNIYEPKNWDELKVAIKSNGW